MNTFRPVSIPRASIFFCRVVTAIMLWIAVIFNNLPLVIVVGIILGWSALSGIQKAPLVLLYTLLFKNKQTEIIMVDACGMQFAQALGSALALLFALAVYYQMPFAWGLVIGLTLVKTLAVFDICPAAKLFNCATSGRCCVFLKSKP